MILSMSEQKDLLEDLIKDLDNLSDLVTVKGVQYLTDAKLKAYMLKTTFIIEERIVKEQLYEDKIGK